MIFEKLTKKGIKNLTYLTRGKRGLIYEGKYKNKEVVVKIKKPDSAAEGRIANEEKWLKILNKKGIAPKLLLSDNDFLCCEYVKGEFILDYFKKRNKKEIIAVIKTMLEQMLVLDSLKMNKEEMHRPFRHIIIDSKNKPWLIDFERCYETEKPKNTTQFCQFLLNSEEELRRKEICLNRQELMDSAKEYKNEQSKKNFNRIIRLVK